MSLPVGYFCLILHAHLPFVRHPENDDFLEEDWLYEAIGETYLPLLEVFLRLREEGIPYRLTLSISPTLAEMLSDPLLKKRFDERLEKRLELTAREVRRTSRKPQQAFHEAACLYQQMTRQAAHLYRDVYGGDVLHAFRELQEEGYLELITCAATHGLLPLMATAQGRRAQIRVALANYRKHYGCACRGIWLPECGYDPSLDDLLDEAGVDYFFLDAHGVLNATPAPKYGTYAPILTPALVAAFARDAETSRQVWSREIGYPGDCEYREFYRDLGYDAFYDYIRPYLHQDGVRREIGLKYHRITDPGIDLAHKEPYRPALARQRVIEHTEHFVENRCRQVLDAAPGMDVPPLIVAPFDAELFGHWWFEGPQFIEQLFRRLAEKREILQPVTPTEYLSLRPRLQQAQPAASTWGHRGHYEVWLNDSNDWIYRHLHHCERRLVQLAREHPNAAGLRRRVLNQLARELLLAQSSDWAFIMTANTAVSYARRRTREHIHQFLRLDEQLQQEAIDEAWLSDLERRNNLFPEIDYRAYRNPPAAASQHGSTGN